MTELAEQKTEATPRREHWKAVVAGKVEKWNDCEDAAAIERARAAGRSPDEVVEIEGNLLLNAGSQRLLDLLIGAGGQALNNANSRIGVGDGTTAAAAGDTDLSAIAGSTHRYFMTMDATYPSRASQTVTWRATFASADGNFHWQEWGIDAGTAGGTTVTAPLLNRKVTDLGTKASGASWQFSVTVTIS